MEEQRTANVVLTADVDPYQRSMAEANKSTSQLAKNIETIGTKLGDLNKKTGKGLVGFGVGIGATLTAATLSAGKFEKNLSTLAAQAVVTNKNMGALTSGVKQLSRDFPVSLNQASQLVTMLSQMGVVSEQQISKMSSALVQLSGATGSDLMSISSGMVELGRTMGTLNANNMDKYANSLTNVSLGAGVAAESVVSLANNIAPVARLAGMGQEQVIGLAGAFTKAGADGYAGATAFNRVVYGLTRTLQFGGPELKTYADLIGKTSDQIQGMDSAEAVLQIFEGLNEQGPMAIKTLDSLGLDGLRTMRSIQAVIQSGELRQSVLLAENGPDDSLTKAAEESFTGLLDSTQKLGNNFQQLGISIGQHFLPPITAATDAATKLLGAMNKLVDLPVIGKGVAGASVGIGAIAGTVGMGMLGAGLISKVVGLGMAGGVLRSGFGGMRLGQGLATSAADDASKILNDPKNQAGLARFRPSMVLARTGYMAGEQMGPPTGQPGLTSRISALPLRGATWLSDSQRAFVQNSQLMRGAPLGVAALSASDAAKSTASWMKQPIGAMGIFGKEATAAAMAQKAATAQTVGLGAAFSNLTKSSMMLATTYGKASLATMGAAARGVGGAAMGLMGGPTGMAIMGSIGVGMLANWSGSLPEQRTSDWNTLAANKYLEKAGEPATVASSFQTSGLEAEPLSSPNNRKDAALISAEEEELASGLNYEYVEPAVKEMSEASAKAFVQSMGFMSPEQTQYVGQDLTAAFDKTFAEEVLAGSLAAYPNQQGATKNLMDSDSLSGMISGIDVNESLIFDQRQTTGTPLLSKEYWRTAFGGLPEGQAEQYETAVEQLGAQQALVTQQYGTKAGDARAITGIYELMSAVPQGDTAGRNKLESLLKEEYGLDFNYEGWDRSSSRTITPEDIQHVIATGEFDSGKTGEDYAQSMGRTLVDEDSENYLDLSVGKDRRDFNWAAVENSKKYSDFSLTELGGLFDKARMQTLAASDESNDLIKVAEKLLKAAEKTDDTLGSLNEAAAQAPQPLEPAFQLAQQLEQRKFDQNLWSMGLNSWDAQAIGIGRTKQQIGALDPESKTYDEDLLRMEDQLFAQFQAQRQSYEQVILAQREFNVSMERSDEEYQIAVERSEISFYRQREWAQDDFNRNRLRAENDFNRQMQYMVEDAMSTVYDPYARITTMPTLDAGNLMLNIEEQNQALEQQEKNLKRLRKAGVDQATIDFLGLADPKNAQQLARLLADIRSDPKVIRELNKLTEDRAEGTETLVASHWSRQYRRAVDEFERQSRRANADFTRQMSRNNELFNEQLRNMQEDHERMMDNALEDFERSFKEVVGKFGSVEQRALNILKDAGVKVMDTGENQMDKILKSISQKYNFTMRMIDRLTGMDSSAGGGGGSGVPSAVSNSGGGSGGVTEMGDYKGTSVRISGSGSSTTAPVLSPRTRVDAAKQDRRGIDDNLDRRNKFLKVLYNQLGKPYNQIGDDGPGAFDCSGLTKFAANKVGISLVHSANTQISQARKISGTQAIPGDLVAYDNGPRVNGYDHIGVYVGNGNIIHAPTPGSVVQVGSVNQDGRRIFGRIKGLAEGGIATQRMQTEIAEAGYPEAVIPLNNQGHGYMLNMYKAISREMVKEISTKQLGISAAGGYGNQYINASTNFTGEITVKADDPGVMLKKLEQRKRRDALLKPSSARSS